MSRPAAFALGLLALLWTGAAWTGAAWAGPGKLVAAHYMVCCPRAGPASTVADFEAEIREAHAAGIDAFALNCGAWIKYPLFQRNARLLFEAARRSGLPFRLFFSPDFAEELSTAESADMVLRYARHPNHLAVDGRPVLSSFAGTPAWAREVRALVAAKGGVDPFLIPFFYPPGNPEVVRARDVRAVAEAAGDAVDGYLYFGTAGPPRALAESIALHAPEWARRGKAFMAAVAPYYRGLRKNYRVFENRGFEGFALQWEAALRSGADWVEIVTWNDWSEASYIAPLDASDPMMSEGERWGPLLRHSAFLDLTRYYAAWFKGGHPPAIDREALHYAFRLHERGTGGRIDPPRSDQALPRGALALADEVHVAALLREPAEITVTVGGVPATRRLEAGLTRVSVPMRPGEVAVSLRRSGAVVASGKAPFPITGDEWANYDMLTGRIPFLTGGIPSATPP